MRRRVTLRGTAHGEARIREPLGTSLGAPTLAALPAALAHAEGWRREEHRYVHSLEGGYVAYLPESREIEIVATGQRGVEAAGDAGMLLRGELTETFEAEGEGVYYTDGEGGHTPASARRVAETRAQHALDHQVRDALHAAQEAAELREAAALESDAGSRARNELDRRTAEVSEELRRDAALRLEAVGVQARNAFHRVLAVAYRDAILAYARSRGALGVVCAERDGVVDIQFELEV
ncbi:hypothetical protein J5X84_15585 [Streptosporangiaceae bacterium NEAU-GS5]|nr:hypothetical protein [Streptosporangiaceae bacterium NEAU-GS5]